MFYVICTFLGKRERDERETGFREKQIEREEKRGREGGREPMKNCPPLWKSLKHLCPPSLSPFSKGYDLFCVDTLSESHQQVVSLWRERQGGREGGREAGRQGETERQRQRQERQSERERELSESHQQVVRLWRGMERGGGKREREREEEI